MHSIDASPFTQPAVLARAWSALEIIATCEVLQIRDWIVCLPNVATGIQMPLSTFKDIKL